MSECSPKDVRGRITGLFQIMVAIGVMISYFINREYHALLKTGFSMLTNPSVSQWASACTSPPGLMSGESRSASSSYLLAS